MRHKKKKAARSAARRRLTRMMRDAVGLIYKSTNKTPPYELSVPLVLGTPGIRGSCSTAIRSARAVALNTASAM